MRDGVVGRVGWGVEGNGKWLVFVEGRLRTWMSRRV